MGQTISWYVNGHELKQTRYINKSWFIVVCIAWPSQHTYRYLCKTVFNLDMNRIKILARNTHAAWVEITGFSCTLLIVSMIRYAVVEGFVSTQDGIQSTRMNDVWHWFLLFSEESLKFSCLYLCN